MEALLKKTKPQQSSEFITQREDKDNSGMWERETRFSYLLGSSPQSYTHKFFPWSQYKLHCVHPRPHLLLFCTSLLSLVMFFHKAQKKRSLHSHIQLQTHRITPCHWSVCLTTTQIIIYLKLMQEEFFGGELFSLQPFLSFLHNARVNRTIK